MSKVRAAKKVSSLLKRLKSHVGRNVVPYGAAGILAAGKAGELGGEKYRSYRDPRHKKDIQKARGAHKKRKYSIKGNSKDPRLVRIDKRAANYLVLNNEKQMAAMGYSARKKARKGKKTKPQTAKNLRAYKAYLKNENRGALERIEKY